MELQKVDVMVAHLAARSAAEKAGTTGANLAARLVGRMVAHLAARSAAEKAGTMGV